jgi:GT2 family glycosyltransferase
VTGPVPGGAAPGAPPGAGDERVAVVIATRDRPDSLARTLARLGELPERPEVVVVDNASREPPAAPVTERAPWARLVLLPRNLGAGARTVGARTVGAPYVAFCDDDSWWEPGSLARAADLMDAHPRLGLLAARVLVGPERRDDPVCSRMATGPLGPAAGLPGVPVLGFLACGAIVRRSAFLAVGGFERRLGIGGEEELLAMDLADAGWRLAYVPEVTARHEPAPRRADEARRRRQARNAFGAHGFAAPRAARPP